MKFHCLPLLLLLTCAGQTWGTSLLSRRPHRTSPRSAPRDPDLALSSGLPPQLGNSTNTLCYFLPLPDIARAFGGECSAAFARLENSSLGSEEEKGALVEVCTSDCMGGVVQFLEEECQDTVVSMSLLVFCAESHTGDACHIVTNSFNRTFLDLACPLSVDGALSGCSSECSRAVSDAVDSVGCCSNYHHLLSLSVAECGLQMPQLCPDLFKEEEKEGEGEGGKEDDEVEEEDSDKTEDGEAGGKDKTEDDKPRDGEQGGVLGVSGDSIARPFIPLLFSLLTIYLVFG